MAAAIAFSSCDAAIDYTVRNESDESVGTGWFSGECSPEREQRLRKGALDEVVAPNAESHVGGAVAKFPDCVVIRTRDDEVALIAAYHERGVYIVSGSRKDGTLGFRFLGRR